MPVDRNDPDADVAARIDVPARRPPDNAPEWMLHAWAEYQRGVKEVSGDAANPRILEYFNATSLAHTKLAKSDETPWCSAFACYCMEQSGIKSPRSAMAKSWQAWGEKADNDPTTGEPKYGSVVVLWRNFPASASGHVGFFVSFEGTQVWLLGGNQYNSVSFAKYPRMRILGFRQPKLASPPPLKK